ncbi:hypothetical protein CAOG_002658 [Capsaspora owczarzaki ATCC 30864]|uniref:Ubiquitin-like-conjugating enzyme ATG10 n=2 Tax=Capsaspora owczarzaki (strain ATCC 30864) TaxID=595528 RepID=A0A0D2WLP4_CAPO3|nr:hypothetical protein CAOG_002658 [Capsaspora owczarzaki ATCC 30864]
MTQPAPRPGSVYLVKRSVSVRAAGCSRSSSESIQAAETQDQAQPVSPANPGLEAPIEDIPDMDDVYTEEASDPGELRGSSNLTSDSASFDSWHTYEYHVVYHKTYTVPVLYFNASTLEGKRLTVDQVWNDMHNLHKDSIDVSRSSFLSQAEHPVLGKPFFFLHPCQTCDMMVALFGPRLAAHCSPDQPLFDYLLAFLSIVAPIVRLNLPLQYHAAQSKLVS